MCQVITLPSMDAPLARRLRADAIALGDEAIRLLRAERPREIPGRLEAAVECMKISTRLSLVIAWTLNRSAVEAGEITMEEARAPDRRLGAAPASGEEDLATLSPAMREIALRSIALHRRAAHQATLTDAVS